MYQKFQGNFSENEAKIIQINNSLQDRKKHLIQVKGYELLKKAQSLGIVPTDACVPANAIARYIMELQEKIDLNQAIKDSQISYESKLKVDDNVHLKTIENYQKLFKDVINLSHPTLAQKLFITFKEHINLEKINACGKKLSTEKLEQFKERIIGTIINFRNALEKNSLWQGSKQSPLFKHWTSEI